MYKTTVTCITLTFASVFLAGAVPAAADTLDAPSGLADEMLLHEQPLYAEPGAGDGNIIPPNAVMEEELWAAPFQWGTEEGVGALPLSGASWWTGIDSELLDVAEGRANVNELFDFQLTYNANADDAPGNEIHSQTLYGGDNAEFDWTPSDGQERFEGSDWNYFRIGSSSSSGWYDTWNPGEEDVEAGEILWFSVQANLRDEDKWGESSIRWLRGANVPTAGSDGGLPPHYNDEGTWMAPHEEGVSLAHSQHVVPEPASMTLLGLGLAGFATRRFLGNRKRRDG